jgi:tetratricopeptide (TPR) repeat protein
LRFTEARELISSEKSKHPLNPIPVYLENYIDFLNVFIGEEPAAFEKFTRSEEAREAILAKANQDSPYARYCLGNMRLQAAICHIKFGEYKAASLDISHAYGTLKDNVRLFPGFLPQDAGLGMIHILAGILPDNYKWVLWVLGLDGNVKQGMDEISKLAGYSGSDETWRMLRMESMFYMAFLDATLGKDAGQALQILQRFEKQGNAFPDPANPIWIFIKASILQKSGKTDDAIASLSGYHPGVSDYYFCYLDYLTGLNKLNRMDPDADLYFIRFLKNFRGQNYIKSAYQKLAWTFLLKGNTTRYEEYIAKALSRGAMFVDADRQANREAKEKEIPNVVLLKSRLYCDGGYTARALQLLLSGDARNSFHTPRDLLEYTYRLGRIYQQAGNTSEALRYFATTIQDGAEQPWYFAESAALQSALICEQNKDYSRAGVFFRRCLSMKNTEYKNSLDQKARLGLKRIKPYLP